MIAGRVLRAAAIARQAGVAPTSTLLQRWVAAEVASRRGLAGFAVEAPTGALGGAHEALVDGWEPTPDDVGLVHEVWVTQTGGRRERGAHYTPRAVAEAVVARTLAPLEGPLSVADLSCGGGAFLLAALRWARARGVTIELVGLDIDADAAHACRLALCLEAGAANAPSVKVNAGDGLSVDPSPSVRPFDAVVGNPPWVSYAGRAAQPLSEDDRRRYSSFAAFAGFRNLQALFVERGAEALRPGGRLGLVLPTSMSDLAGYAASRRAHDALCVVDDALVDLADGGFEGVFQPCMALTSTRRAARVTPVDASWPLARADLDAATRAFLARLGALQKLPAALFGERGYQSSPADKAKMRAAAFDGSIALLTGTEVRPFERLLPTTHVDPRALAQKLRSREEYRAVDVLIRQTARFPMAALSDGGAFRNSVLAGFGVGLFSAGFLVAWLNAWPVRAFHYLAHRDARQGMPQLKIGHLRALPAPASPALVGEIVALGARLGAANLGASAIDQQALDELVARALGMNDEDREVVGRVRRLVGG